MKKQSHDPTSRKPFDVTDFNKTKDVFANISVEDDELTFKLSQTDCISDSSIGTKEEMLEGKRQIPVTIRDPSVQRTTTFPKSKSISFN